MKGSTRAALTVAAAIVAGASACGGTYVERTAQPASFRQTSTGVMAVAPLAPAPTATAPVSNMAPPTSPGSMAPSALEPPGDLAREAATIAPEDVLGTLQAASAAQRELAACAEAHARTPEVRSLAAAVETANRDMQVRTERIARELEVTPRDDAGSAALRQDVDDAVARVESAEGRVFDAVYLYAQADVQRKLLDTIEELRRGTSSEVLRDHLAGVSKTTGDHLARTSALEERLAERVRQPAGAGRAWGEAPVTEDGDAKAKRAR